MEAIQNKVVATRRSISPGHRPVSRENAFSSIVREMVILDQDWANKYFHALHYQYGIKTSDEDNRTIYIAAQLMRTSLNLKFNCTTSLLMCLHIVNKYAEDDCDLSFSPLCLIIGHADYADIEVRILFRIEFDVLKFIKDQDSEKITMAPKERYIDPSRQLESLAI